MPRIVCFLVCLLFLPCISVPLLAGTCPEISAEAAAQRITILSNDIRHHDRLYYRELQPVISDGEYDRLFAELVLLEGCFPALAADDSPTRKVGGVADEGSLTIKHVRPMLSLSSSVGPEAVEAMLRRAAAAGDVRILVQPKVDGLPVELVYEGGRLVSAATRGDGDSGQDVTARARLVQGISLLLSDGCPQRVVVRGEIYADRRSLRRTGGSGDGYALDKYSSPRHLAAGTLQSQNPHPEALAALRLFPFELVHADRDGAIGSDMEALRLMAGWGLPVDLEQTRQVNDLGEVRKIYEEYLAVRDRQPFAMDGIVVKIDDLALRRRLGEGARFPFWAAAWKFPPPTVRTEVRAIRWQVGRTGRRTPVAEVAPVRLGGVLVRRVSLHNAAEIERLDIGAGDRVVLGLVGDVIPRVLEVTERIPRKADAAAAKGELPQPAMDACLRDDPGCREQFLARLVHFASKSGLNIAGIGRGRLTKLVEAGLVRDLPSLFLLQEEDVAAIPGFGGKTARKLTDAVRAVGCPDPFRLIVAIGIPGVGKGSAEKLARRFPSLNSLLEAGEGGLCQLPPGERRAADAVRSFFRTGRGAELLQEFRGLGMLKN